MKRKEKLIKYTSPEIKIFTVLIEEGIGIGSNTITGGDSANDYTPQVQDDWTNGGGWTSSGDF